MTKPPRKKLLIFLLTLFSLFPALKAQDVSIVATAGVKGNPYAEPVDLLKRDTSNVTISYIYGIQSWEGLLRLEDFRPGAGIFHEG